MLKKFRQFLPVVTEHGEAPGGWAIVPIDVHITDTLERARELALEERAIDVGVTREA